MRRSACAAGSAFFSDFGLAINQYPPILEDVD
jgi:hypothetical protein